MYVVYKNTVETNLQKQLRSGLEIFFKFIVVHKHFPPIF